MKNTKFNRVHMACSSGNMSTNEAVNAIAKHLGVTGK